MIFALRLSLGIVVLTACEKPPAATLTPTVPMLTALGRRLFFDSTLSVSGRMSCATCHNPQFGWGPANALPVQPGGPDNIAPGVRAVLSLGYAQDTHPFDEHFREDEGENRDDQGPAGGRMWDGRARSAYEQAALPLLSSFEMANPNRAAVLARLRASSVARAFREAFGARVLDDSLAAWEGLLSALESFQQSPDEGSLQRSGKGKLRGVSSERAAWRRVSAVYGSWAHRARCAAQPAHRRQRGLGLL